MRSSSTIKGGSLYYDVQNCPPSTGTTPSIQISNLTSDDHKILQNSGVIRLSAIFLMTFVHVGFPEVEFFRQWLGNGLGRISAPLLGMLSGYIFMLRPAPTFISTLMKKVRSLGTPFLIFSGAYILIMYFLTDRYKADLSNIIIGNSFLGIYAWPSNYPLHYLIDLFKVSVLAYIVCRFFAGWANQYSFLFMTLFVGTLFLIVLGDPFVSHNRYSILPRADLFAFFFLGIILFRARNVLEKILDGSNFRFTLLVFSLSIFVYITENHEWIWIRNEQNSGHELEQSAGSLMQLLARLVGSIVLLIIISYLPIISARIQERMTRLALILFGTHVITMHFIEHHETPYMDSMNFLQSIVLIYAAFFSVAVLLFALETQIRSFWIKWLRPKRSASASSRA